jgi:hypothetical protein
MSPIPIVVDQSLAKSTAAGSDVFLIGEISWGGRSCGGEDKKAAIEIEKGLQQLSGGLFEMPAGVSQA